MLSLLINLASVKTME